MSPGCGVGAGVAGDLEGRGSPPVHQAQLGLRGLSGCQPQAPLLQAPLLQELQGRGQALWTLDLTLGAAWMEISDSSLRPHPPTSAR